MTLNFQIILNNYFPVNFLFDFRYGCVEDAGAGGTAACSPWSKYQARMQLQSRRGNVVLGKMVQRRKRVLSIRTTGKAACARFSAARCHGERKNHIVLIFFPCLVPLHPLTSWCFLFKDRCFSFLSRIIARLPFKPVSGVSNFTRIFIFGE